MIRRRVVSGMLGGVAIHVGLPFFDAVLNSSGTALAGGAPLPTCFGTWLWGCGLNPGRWEPKAVGASHAFGPELKPLEAFKSQINIFSGLQANLDGKPNVPHESGILTILTGSAPSRIGGNGLTTLDQLIANNIGSRVRFRSLEVACSGKSTDTVSVRSGSGINASEISPVALYGRIFGADFRDPNAANFVPDPGIIARRSALSVVAEQRADLMKSLGAADRARADEYFTSLRQLEQQLTLQLEKPPVMQACKVLGQGEEAKPNEEIGAVQTNHKLFTGLLTQALACGQTRVINVLFSPPTSTLRKSGIPESHHIRTHEEPIDAKLGYQADVAWFNGQIMDALRGMIASLAGVKEGAGTLLDRTLLLALTDVSFAKNHTVVNIPIMTVGKAGGRVKTGMHVAAPGDTITRIGFTLQQIFGLPVNSWGTESNETSKTIGEILA